MAKPNAAPPPIRSAAIARLILAGLVLTGLPVLAALMHLRSAPTDTVLQIPVSVEQSIFGPRLVTAITEVDLNDLAGDDDFKIGQRAYVHSAVYEHNPQARSLAYPFAISHRRAASSTDTVSMRAIVVARSGNTLTLDYQFEDIASRPELLHGLTDTDLSAEVSVSIRAVPRLKAIKTGDQPHNNHPRNDKAALLGQMRNGASTAPATYPAR